MILTKKSRNTEEYQDGKGNTTITLYGKPIVFKTDKSLYINLQNKNTLTTRRVINQVFEKLCLRMKIHNIDYSPHINNRPLDCNDDWVEVYRYED